MEIGGVYCPVARSWLIRADRDNSLTAHGQEFKRTGRQTNDVRVVDARGPRRGVASSEVMLPNTCATTKTPRHTLVAILSREGLIR